MKDYVIIFFSFCMVIFAFLQWKTAQNMHNSNLFQLRTKHLIDLFDLWKQYIENLEYISGYKAKFKKPDDYMQLTILMRKLNNHKEFTRCYFSNKTYLIFEEFIRNIISTFPPDDGLGSIYEIDVARIDNIFKEYNLITKYYIEEIKPQNIILNKIFNRNI